MHLLAHDLDALLAVWARAEGRRLAALPLSEDYAFYTQARGAWLHYRTGHRQHAAIVLRDLRDTYGSACRAEVVEVWADCMALEPPSRPFCGG